MPLILPRASLRLVTTITTITTITIITILTNITILTTITMITLIAPTPRIVSLARPSLQRDYSPMIRISTMSTADICMRLIPRCWQDA
jgi:hypothetical protein